MIKVNPCPFCKSKKIGYSLKTHGHYDRIYHATMYCKDCNAYGPRVIVHPGDRTRDEIQTDKTYQEMAVNLWNKAETTESIVGGIFGNWKKGGKKMTDREKLVYLIKENAKAIVSSTENGVCVCLDVEALADHLIAHGVYVRESQKPCKFEEISSSDYCWIEYKYEFYTTVEIACALYKTSEYCRIDFVGHGSSITHKKELYNKTWRCWAEKPTEAERKNAKWEE